MDARLERWLQAVVSTPGLTAIDDEAEARSMLLDDALRASELVRGLNGPVVDVGSGGGSPGIPLAAVLPDRQFVLLEAQTRKCAFLEATAREFSNVTVVHGRAEEQEAEQFGVALAKALARPPVAVEWCLPLVREGGAVILWVGPNADLDAVAQVSPQVGGGRPVNHDGLVLVPKTAPTPPGFPRRPGVAKKRPLA